MPKSKAEKSKSETVPAIVKTIPVKATGDPWQPDPKNPATVPIPNAVIITKINGPYTEKDRKLWTFLIHIAWDNLLTKKEHEVAIVDVNRIFKELGGDTSQTWIWESFIRLCGTRVEWEEGPDNNRLKGVANLLSAAKTQAESKDIGMLYFEISNMLAQVIRHPTRFSRIRLHFMLSLSGKYAVTLYEIFESVANLNKPVLEADLDQLRRWLKVPEGKVTRYADIKRRLLEPGIRQINKNAAKAGFTVEMTPIKKRRTVVKIRFILTKTEERIQEEKMYIGSSRMPPPAIPLIEDTVIKLKTTTYEKAKKAAPYFDIYELEQQWLEWIQKKGSPNNPDAAFIAFCKKKQAKVTKT
jgi:hypothetical protein